MPQKTYNLEKYNQIIYDYFYKNLKMPSYETMKSLFKVSSKDTVFNIVEKLVNLKYINKDKSGKILPLKSKITLNRNPIFRLGVVDAGFPSFVEMEDLDTISLEDFLIGDKRATFMLKVKGNSMIDAGIIDGDFVIVEQGKEPKVGDIVLAYIDGGWTLKYFQKDKLGIYLKPANKEFKILRPENNLEIKAVVISLVRKYEKG